MAHFAQLDDNDIVKFATVVDNDRLDPENEEATGIAYLRRIPAFGPGSEWAQTHFNANGLPEKRYHHAGVGYKFRRDLGPRGAFIPPKPFDSAVLNEQTMEWEPPVPKPVAPGDWYWDEDDACWVDDTGAMTNVDFVLRFTQAEMDAVEASTVPQVVAARTELKRTPIVRPKHPRTIAGLTAIEAAGLLDGPGRKAEILG